MRVHFVLASFVYLLSICAVTAQKENVLLQRSFWKTNPNLAQVQHKINEGHDPAALNRYAFDPVVYALLEKADSETIKFLLSQEGNSVKKRTHDSRTYLFWAAYTGNTEIMQYLFSKGAVIDIYDSHGNTPVTFAAATGQKKQEVYDLFEKAGATLTKEVNKEGINSLFLIAPYLTTDKELTYFLDKGFNLNKTDSNGNNLFLHAAKGGNVDFLQLLIEKGVSPTLENNEGGNAILYASMGTRKSKYELTTFKFLEQIGVKPNKIGNYRRNALHTLAHRCKDIEIINYFLSKNLDVNLQDKGGDTPFMNAANSNTIEIVKLLGKNVENINMKDENGRSALTMAINRNTIDVVEYLLLNGADISVKDNDGNTLAYFLLNTYKSEEPTEFESKLKVLIREGFQVNQLQNNNNTLYHLAAKQNNLALLKRLKEFNIPINLKNSDGLTVLQLAAMKTDNVEMLKYLVAEGADNTSTTEFGETVIDLAKENELLQHQNINLKFLE